MNMIPYFVLSAVWMICIFKFFSLSCDVIKLSCSLKWSDHCSHGWTPSSCKHVCPYSLFLFVVGSVKNIVHIVAILKKSLCLPVNMLPELQKRR
jgi:hypothetical protein